MAACYMCEILMGSTLVKATFPRLVLPTMKQSYTMTNVNFGNVELPIDMLGNLLMNDDADIREKLLAY